MEAYPYVKLNPLCSFATTLALLSTTQRYVLSWHSL